MKLSTILLAALFWVPFLCSSCANTDTPVSRAIGAQMQAKAFSTPMGASATPQRTGMQDFFARGGAQ